MDLRIDDHALDELPRIARARGPGERLLGMREWANSNAVP
jgi:hypothetical protein